MAKLILHHAQVITMDDRQPQAEAVLVEDGKIARVGTDAEILSLADSQTQVRDLEGKTLLPGFFDSHSHFTAVAYAQLMVNAKPSPSGHCDTKEQLLAEFQAALDAGDWSDGRWLTGMGYDPSVFPDKQHITRLDLDRVSTEVPISCIHASGHMSVVNTKGLQLLGYWGDFTPPEGGTVERFPDGTPNGLITELAFLSPDIQGKMHGPTPEEVVGALGKTNRLYASYGITTAQDARVTMGEAQLLEVGGSTGQIGIDIITQVAPDCADALLTKGLTVAPYQNHVRMSGYKLFLDGSPQGKTAWLSQPYYEAPEGQSADYCGFPQYQDEEVIAAAETCLRNRWQLNVHCNGDAACEQLIRCYEQAIERTGIHEDLRPVMVHAQTVREDQLDRMKAIGMIATFFLDHIYYWGDYHYSSVLGPERAQRISPAGSALRKGISFTVHQDSPVVNPDCLLAVQNAVCRRTMGGRVLGEDQRLSVYEALKAITVNGAYQVFEEKSKGSITPGKLADLVILAENPMTVAPDHIRDIAVLETIKEGKTIYEA